MFSDTQLREAFHLYFLDRLLKLSGPDLYVLKGGVNLRFFFNSPRYSEDMDLDVLAGSVETLKKNGYKILEDAAFQRSLRFVGIDAIHLNDPAKAKHTQTTQRFRCTLLRSSGQRLPTKVEFSRRAGGSEEEAPGEESVHETLNPLVTQPYRKLAYACRHYTGRAAVVQKVGALDGRAATQARDVFDLNVLIQGGHFAAAAQANALAGAPLAGAMDALMSLDWQDYEGQVVAFLDDDSRKSLGNRAAWEAMQLRVLEALQTHA